MRAANPSLGDRAVRIPGLVNVRDLGGLPIRDGVTVRRGLLLRSAELARLEPAGAALLDEFGLRTVIDLRTNDEVGQRPDRLNGTKADLHTISLLPVNYHEIPVYQVDLYVYLAESCTKETAQAVKVLAAPGALPGLFHCAVGKDRTGFLAAVILALLGVPDEEIISDFMLSNAELGFPEPGESEPVHVPTLPSRSAIRPELLADALGRIRDQHGDIAAYLRSGGVTDLELDSLTTALTDRG